MAQTIEYADFALTTGSDDGSSWANAYKTPTTLMAGDLANGAGYDYYLASGTFAWTTKLFLYNAVGQGTAAQPIRWIAVDKSDDTLVDATNWVGFGGAIGTILDFTGAAANQDGIYSEGRNYRHFIGITIKNCTSEGFYFYSGYNMILQFCESDGATTFGLYTRTGANVNQCIFRGSALGIGSNAGNTMVEDCLFIDNTIDYNGTGNTRLRNCVFSGFTTGVTGHNVTTENCTFYDGTTGILGTDAGWGVQAKDCVFEDVTTVVDIVDDFCNLQNIKYYGQTTFIGKTTGEPWNFGGNEETAAAPLVDPVNDDYAGKSTATELVNNDCLVGPDTTNYRQSGLIQEVSAGGGGKIIGQSILIG